jgi:hypothetical protein
LTHVPAITPVTFTLIVQDVPGDNTAPVPPRLIVLLPATAVIVPVHVVETPFGVDTTSPAGSVSLNSNPVRITLTFGLANVNVKPVLWLAKTCAAPKVFAMVGTRKTVMLAVPVLPVPPLVEKAATELF